MTFETYWSLRFGPRRHEFLSFARAAFVNVVAPAARWLDRRRLGGEYVTWRRDAPASRRRSSRRAVGATIVYPSRRLATRHQRNTRRNLRRPLRLRFPERRHRMADVHRAAAAIRRAVARAYVA